MLYFINMPSYMFNTFRYNLVEVNWFIESHKALKGTTQEKKGLSHITRSTGVTLCAAEEISVDTLR